jgi:sigma-B regulation protein RsbU (phosphoserine phosphatase)
VLMAAPPVIDGLVEELGRAWNGIDALAEIIAARGGSAGAESVLHRLLAAACIGRPATCGAAWSVQGGDFRLVAQVGGGDVDELARQLAEACARDGRTRIGSAEDFASQVPRHAPRAIATRGDTPSGSRAVLALWSPLEAEPFDSLMPRIAEALAVQVALVVEEGEWMKRLLHQERSDADLQAARLVQASLLETPASGRSALITWAGLSRPARVVGGDFHDVNPLPSGGVDVVVGDVMGKGLPGALLGAACLNHLLRAAVNAPGPGAILTRANQTLSPDLVRLETFASAIFLRIHGEPLLLTVADAGHACLAIRRADGSVTEPRGRETLLGVEREAFGETTFPLHAGDLILVFTDGLADAGRPKGRTFNVAHWLASTPATGPDAVVRHLAEHIEAVRAESGAPEDDITCVVLGVNPR